MSSPLASNTSLLPYRPDIDGLRAVAVLAVIVFHAFPGYAPGGFVGVDIFFVISGYLITSILLKELAAGEFSYAGFYARRFRRIAPALLVVLLVTWSAGWFFLLADEFASLGKHVLAGSAFVSNFLLWQETGYFDAAVELKPLLHLWSLGVEEQFYLIWPLLLVWWSRRWRRLAYLIGAVFAVSFAVNVMCVEKFPSPTFYLLPARFWELLIGGGLAYAVAHGKTLSNVRGAAAVANIIAALATLVLAGSILYLDKTLAYPGWWAILPTVGTCLLIFAGPATWVNRRLLSHGPAVFIGRISYPLYLWHWPLLSFAYILCDEKPSRTVRISVVIASFALAWLTWRFVEQPARSMLFAKKSPEARTKHYLTTAAASIAAVACLGWFTAGGLLFSETQREMQKTVGAYGLSYERQNGRAFSCTADAADIDTGCRHDKRPYSLAIWGDSHSWRLFPGMLKAFGSHATIHQFQRGGCAPLLDNARTDDCGVFNAATFEALAKQKPQVVVLAARWQAYFFSPSFFSNLDGVIHKLKESGVEHIVVIGHAPTWTPSLYKIAARKFLANGREFPQHTRIGLDDYPFAIDAEMKKHPWGGGVTYVSLIDALCNASGCLTMVGEDLANDLITYDYGHFTVSGSSYVVDHIIEPVISPLIFGVRSFARSNS